MKSALLLVSFVTFAALTLAQQSVLPWEKNRDRIGLDLYRENCVVCHDIDKPQYETKKLGLSFQRLFQTRKRDYVAVRIRLGGQLMPAFAKKMTAGEMEMLLDWIERRTGPPSPSSTPATASGEAR